MACRRPIDTPVADPVAAFARELEYGRQDPDGERRPVWGVPLRRHRQLGHRRPDVASIGASPSTPSRSASARPDIRSCPMPRLVAREFATRHSELLVSAEDLMQYLPKLIEHGDAPVAEASNIPIYLLSREAAKSVKMVLTGEGSDELLGGYPKHSAERFAGLYQRLVPACLHRAAVEPLISLLPYRLPAHQDHDLLDRPARSARAAAALAGRALLGRARPAAGRRRASARRPIGGRSSGTRGARPAADALFRSDILAARQSAGARRSDHHGRLHRGPDALHGYRGLPLWQRGCRTAGGSGVSRRNTSCAA